MQAQVEPSSKHVEIAPRSPVEYHGFRLQTSKPIRRQHQSESLTMLQDSHCNLGQLVFALDQYKFGLRRIVSNAKSGRLQAARFLRGQGMLNHMHRPDNLLD